MPYIEQYKRNNYNPDIASLTHILIESDSNDELSGELNYIFFCLAKRLCDPDMGGERSYARMSVVSSALSEAQAEFRRTIMGLYEDEKRELNGDVI